MLKIKVLGTVGACTVSFLLGGGTLPSAVLAESNQSAWEAANTKGMKAYQQGRYAEAKQWFSQALAATERTGKPTPSQALTLLSLAAVHEALGETEEAELRYQQSLYAIETLQGPNHPDLLPGLHGLAHLYIQSGKSQKAEPLLLRYESILEYHLGESHPHLIPSLLELAHLYLDEGRVGEAETYYVKALTIADSDLDSSHPQTVTILKEYALLLRCMNRNTEAARLEERVNANPLSKEGKNGGNSDLQE